MYHRIIQRLSVNNFYLMHLCIAAFNCAALLFVFLLERIANLNPCKLCLLERIPCAILACSSLLALILKTRLRFYSLAFEGVVLFGACTISFIHVLVEHGILASFCVSHINYSGMSLESSIEQVMNSTFTPDCGKGAFKILFFSLAEMNLVYNLMLCYIVFAVVNTECRKQSAAKKKAYAK